MSNYVIKKRFNPARLEKLLLKHNLQITAESRETELKAMIAKWCDQWVTDEDIIQIAEEAWSPGDGSIRALIYALVTNAEYSVFRKHPCTNATSR